MKSPQALYQQATSATTSRQPLSTGGAMSVKSGPPLRGIDSAIGSPHTPTAADMGLGLQAIYRACYNLYPDQPSPLQVTALKKFWMGGPDPLDYIYMFSNAGLPDAKSPAHWHYVTNGLSDLYGDARLHKCVSLLIFFRLKLMCCLCYSSFELAFLCCKFS